jgi:hypothetical protein
MTARRAPVATAAGARQRPMAPATGRDVIWARMGP